MNLNDTVGMTAGMSVMVNSLRATLPGSRIGECGNLTSAHACKTGGIEENTREEISYLRSMDRLGLPGVTVIEKAPIRVRFDWLSWHRYSDEEVSGLYGHLRAVCANKAGISGIGTAFRYGAGSYEEIVGFKTVIEAQTMARLICAISYHYLRNTGVEVFGRK